MWDAQHTLQYSLTGTAREVVPCDLTNFQLYITNYKKMLCLGFTCPPTFGGVNQISLKL